MNGREGDVHVWAPMDLTELGKIETRFRNACQILWLNGSGKYVCIMMLRAKTENAPPPSWTNINLRQQRKGNGRTMDTHAKSELSTFEVLRRCISGLLVRMDAACQANALKCKVQAAAARSPSFCSRILS